MTENDLSVARDIGSLQSDMRTVKHDVSSISSKIDALGIQIGRINTRDAKGIGFWGGITFAISTSGIIIGGIFTLVKMAMAGGHG